MEININDEGTQWVQRNSNAELEREILYRYVLFSGAAKNSAENLLAGYRGYQSRIVTSSNASSFKIKGDANTVWQRLKIAMDRLGVDTLKENEKLRTLDILVNDLKAENIEESTSWFSSKTNDIDFDDDEYDLAAVKKTESDIEPLKLSVQQIADRKNSTIVIKFLDGKPIEDGKPKLFRDALLKQLN